MKCCAVYPVDGHQYTKWNSPSQDFIETALTLKLKLDCLDDAEPVKSVPSSIQTLFKPIQIGRPIVRVAPVSSSSFYRPWYRLKSISAENKSTESENCLCMDPVYTPPSTDGQSIREKIKFSITHRGQWLRVILCLDTTVTPSDSFTVSTDPWIPVNPKRFQLSVLEDPNQWVRDYLWPVIEDQDPENSDVSNQPDAPTIPSPSQPTDLT
ncbi:hypothetical protein D915_008144 [Fasciola hepatica]|uniref:Uncharacterized protein n=1 Tax=Fasciola hepatica TaxID=6192 RepID=A0A4E0R6L5_FASHE|nr:hypothetical protein D915_008144 [Fasciola hepatica]